MVDHCHLTHLHVFPYSPRTNTPAARMPQIDKSVIKDRANTLRQMGMEKLKQRLSKKVGVKGLILIEFRNFPLDMAAFNASKIAHCKNDGNSEILHHLYKNQSSWVRGGTIEDLNNNLKKFIEESKFKLDFEKCITNSEMEDFILEDRINGAKDFKIEATPTVIINGEKFENTSNYKKLKKYIEKLI